MDDSWQFFAAKMRLFDQGKGTPICAFYHQLQTVLQSQGLILRVLLPLDQSGYDLARYIWVDKTLASTVNPL